MAIDVKLVGAGPCARPLFRARPDTTGTHGNTGTHGEVPLRIYPDTHIPNIHTGTQRAPTGTRAPTGRCPYDLHQYICQGAHTGAPLRTSDVIDDV